MKQETWPREHDVMGWKCFECGHWENFTDAAEGDEHLCGGEPVDCPDCEGRSTGPMSDTCATCNSTGEVPAKGKMVEAWG